MHFLTLSTIALAGAVFAQDDSSSSSAAISSSQSQSFQTQTQSSSSGPSTSQFKLPLYPPYPISSTTVAPSGSISGSASAPASSSSTITSYQSDKYWQHTYRDYYASIITVLSSSTLVYKIDCAPNSAHPSYRNPDFQSFDVCAARVMGRGPMTVTQAPEQWKFAITTANSAFNLTQSRFNDAATSTRLDITCDALNQETKTCSNKEGLAPSTISASAVAAPSLPSGRRSISQSIIGDGAVQQYQSEVSALLENFSTMTEVYVTVTGGFDQLSPSIISSLVNEASGVSTPTPASTGSSSGSSSRGIAQSASTAGAAPRPTGAVSLDLMFGAAGLLGAAVFGL